MVAKKSPNKTKMPYSSTRKPVSGHRTKIKTIPAANAAVPFHFCRRVKKTIVFCTPMMRVRPMRKRIWKSREQNQNTAHMMSAKNRVTPARFLQSTERRSGGSETNITHSKPERGITVSTSTRSGCPLFCRDIKGENEGEEANIARSKNITTPPVKKRPPVPIVSTRDLSITAQRPVILEGNGKSRAYLQNKTPLQSL